MAFQNSPKVQTPINVASFPQNIRDWNVLPDSLISSAEVSDDCLSKFNSLVTARTNFPQSLYLDTESIIF